jgi:hypothetical protein
MRFSDQFGATSMIDLSDEKTWPSEILEMLAQRVGQIRKEKDDEEAAHESGDYILNPPLSLVYGKTKLELESLLKKLEVRAFHCTRLTDFEGIKQSGLPPLSSEFIKRTVMSELQHRGVGSDLLRLIQEEYDRFERSEELNHREGMVWFVLTEKMTDESGCEDLFRYFGGEVTRRALHSLKERIYPMLAISGVPAVVECRLPLSEAAGYQISHIADEFISYGERKYLSNEPYEMRGEVKLTTAVAASRVLGIREKKLTK